MDTTTATRLIGLAAEHPRAAIDEGISALEDPTLDPAVASIVLRAVGIASRTVDLRQSVGHLVDAGERARRAGRDDLLSLAEIAHAGSLYLAGQPEAAHAALARAEQVADDSTRVRIAFQRGTIAARDGLVDDAIALFDLALSGFRRLGDLEFVAATLGNRGMARLDAGWSRAAERDLTDARDGFQALGATLKVAAMDHNLGRLAGRQGDIPAALAQFAAAEVALRALGEPIAEIQGNRLEVLLQAGLFDDAERLASVIEDALDRMGAELERAEVIAARGLALAGAGRHDEAAGEATRAARMFDAQGRSVWADGAQVNALRAQVAAGRQPDIATAVELADRLAAAGQLLGAVKAWTIVALADPLRAHSALAGLSWPRPSPLELRCSAIEIRARARAYRGDTPGALRDTRRVVELVRREQAAAVSTDVRVGLAAQLERVSAFGLSLRRDAARPIAVMRWVEAVRNGSLSVQESPRSRNEAEVALLAELRRAQVALRDSAPSSMVDAVRRVARLERELVHLDRTERSEAGPHVSRASPSVRPAPGSTVVQFHRIGDQLSAVVRNRSACSLIDVTGWADVDRASRSLRFSVDRWLAGRSADPIEGDAAALDRLLFEPLDALMQHGAVVIEPEPWHLALPWSLLPSLRERVVIVAPTLRGHAERQRPAPRHRRVGVIEGDAVLTGATEAERVAAAWHARDGRVRRSADVAGALEMLRSVDVAHLTCHGFATDPERFAHLRLSDGDLTVYDVERLDRTPETVVLSACHGGVLVGRPGQESVGLVNAFLRRGTRSIIASPFALPDSFTTVSVMGDLHTALAGGAEPEQALLAVRRAADGEASPIAGLLTCFGVGC